MLSLEVFSLGQMVHMKEISVNVSQIYLLFRLVGAYICSVCVSCGEEGKFFHSQKNCVTLIFYITEFCRVLVSCFKKKKKKKKKKTHHTKPKQIISVVD